jgi:hypothetical protein
VREHGDELLLSNPVLVEGNLVAPLPDGAELVPVVPAADDGDEPRPYGLLQGVIGTTTVVGVPDVVAYDPDTLREDAQLGVYLVLLHQAGIIPAGATVEIGHLYVSDHVEAVWVDASDLVGTLPLRLAAQVEQTRALVEAGIFMPVKGLLNGYADRCPGCCFAHVCDA